MLGSTCIYPRLAKQPMSEDQFLTGPFEPTNEWYAVAKAAAIKLCQAYRAQYGDDYVSVMPTNLYGPGDNYHPVESHVVAALIRRFHEAKAAGAKEVVVWGTGKPQREFLYVDDLADACVFVLKNYSAPEILNIGVGHDLSIAEFARTGRQSCRVYRRDYVRSVKARRHAAQAGGCDAAQRARLESNDVAGGRAAPRLRGFSRWRRTQQQRCRVRRQR